MAKKINLIPDIDWTKESMNFISNSCVLYTKDEKQTKHAKKVWQGIYKLPVYITQRDNFLSIKCYDISSWTYYRVMDYKKATSERTRLHDISEKYSFSLETKMKVKGQKVVYIKGIASETRVYKNRKAVKVIYGSLMNSRDNDAIALREGYFVINPSSGCCAKEVKTNEDIEAYAVELNRNNASTVIPILGSSGLFIDLRIDKLGGSYGENVSLENKTKEIITTFLDPTSEENFQLLCTYKRAYKTNKVSFSTIVDVKNWLLTKPKDAAPTYNNKTEKAEALVANFKKDWDKEEDGVAYWYRIGDEIVLLYKGLKNMWRGTCLKGIFAYNTKTQKRFCAEFNGIWAFPVPNYKYIVKNFDLNDTLTTSSYYEAEVTKRMRFIKTIVRCSNGVDDLFKGTNMDWVIHNVDKDDKVIPISDNAGGYEPVTVSEVLSEKKITNIVYGIIFSTTHRVLEQFLKSKLWYLYFKGIIQWEEDWLIDVHEEYCGNGEFQYDPTQTNLKKMFGMTMEQLRILNDACKVQRGKLPFYKLCKVERVLGVKLNMLDQETFKRVLAIGKRDYYYGENNFTKCEDLISEIYVNPPLNTRLRFIEIMKEEEIATGNYKDYLNMRKKLQKIQELKPDIPGIWNEKHYPSLPEKGSKFIPFMPGAHDFIIGYRHATIENMHLAYKNSWRFMEMRNRGDMEFTTDGVKLNLNRKEMINLLHDEASYWIQFFEDDTKEELFKEGVKRVDDYTWKDDKSGLEIIAPSSIADLKNEGAVLSHCVGSYVDSIINGGDNIMFIRRTDMEDQPYYTLDFTKSGEIRQVHCFGNGGLSSDEQARAYERSKLEVYNKKFDITTFLKRWARVQAGKIVVDSIKESYGALCAVR